MRRYLIKEMFGPTLQGEGAHMGAPCVFLRFAVCNLACSWCDTDFAPAGARRLDAGAVLGRLLELDRHDTRRVVVTGGEPTLQWDAELSSVVRGAGFRVHMESNGTHPLAAPVDWLTVSPKPQFHEREQLVAGLPVDECKVVVDDTVDAGALARYQAFYPAAQRFLQPCMDARHEQHLARTLDLVARHPSWRLSLQVHKLLGLQ
jgi:7-carboxy-7-deazaguanine synthase